MSEPSKDIQEWWAHLPAAHIEISSGATFLRLDKSWFPYTDGVSVLLQRTAYDDMTQQIFAHVARGSRRFLITGTHGKLAMHA